MKQAARTALLACMAALGSCTKAPPSPSTPILWAWERPEDLRFAPNTEVAVHAAFIEIIGDRFGARGRRHPLLSAHPPSTAVIHIQIDHREPLAWSPELRARVSGAALSYALAAKTPRVQIDFEVRQSERQILLDVLGDVRRGLPKGVVLSMTAIASWCVTEDWLKDAPVDEIVPMLFRMGESGKTIEKSLAKGRDFSNPRCRTALAISTDSPILRAPPGRRVYLFNPRSWTLAEFDKMRRQMEGWR